MQCGDTAVLECLARSLGRMLGSGQDVGQHIKESSTTLKCTALHRTSGRLQAVAVTPPLCKVPDIGGHQQAWEAQGSE